MRKLLTTLFILLASNAYAGCGAWERSYLRPMQHCSGTWTQMCIGGEWQWVCF